jgi:hypothetical protein
MHGALRSLLVRVFFNARAKPEAAVLFDFSKTEAAFFVLTDAYVVVV